MQNPVPSRFKSYFTDLIQRKFKNVKVSDYNFPQTKLFSYYMSGSMDYEASSYIEGLTSDFKVIKEIKSLLLQASTNMQLVFRNADRLIENPSQYDEQQLLDDKFTLFINHAWINDEKFAEILESFDLSLDDPATFFQQMNQYIDLPENDLATVAESVLSSQTDFPLLHSEGQSEILEAVFQRSRKYHEACEILDSCDIEEPKQAIQQIYGVQSQQPEQHEPQGVEKMQLEETKIIESLAEFSPRVKDVLAKYCSKINKLKKQIVDKLLQDLYTHVEVPNQTEVIQILLGLKIFKKSEEVTVQILQEIYKDAPNDTFKAESGSQPVIVEPSKPKPIVKPVVVAQKPAPVPQVQPSQISQSPQRFIQNQSQNNQSFDKSFDQSSIRSLKKPSIKEIEVENPVVNPFQQQMFQNQYQPYPSYDNQYEEMRMNIPEIELRPKNQNKIGSDPYIEQYQRRELDFDTHSLKSYNSKIQYQFVPKTPREGSQVSRGFKKNVNQPKQYSWSDESENKSNQETEDEKKEKLKKMLKEEQDKISRINYELSLIKQSTKGTTCFEKLLRQLQLNVIKQNTNKITQIVAKLKEMIEKYDINCDVTSDLEKLQNSILKKVEKIAKVIGIRRAIEGINLEEIIQTKKEIDLNKDCEGASAIMIVGYTGAGKSTMMVGLSGYTLERNAETGDFQCTDQTIRDKYKISNSTMSVTRWANVSKVKEGWSGKTKVLLIDTPGLDDNRGVEIDITNNLGTVKLLKTLGRGRIVIAISLNDFNNRWFDGFKRLIKNVSKYFTDIAALGRSITFVLTRGLTAERLKSEFQAFLSCQGYTKQNWSDNQGQLIEQMKQKLNMLSKDHEIHDPSNHSFLNLARRLMNVAQTDNPGQYIDCSFSTQTMHSIDKTFVYIKSMITKTFEKGQFILVKYYLENLKALEAIDPRRRQSDNCIKNIKNSFKSSIDEFQNLMKDYSLNGSTKTLQDMKNIQNKIKSSQAIDLYDAIYIDEPQIPYPNEIISKLTSTLALQMQNLVKMLSFQECYKGQVRTIEKQTKKKIFYSLSLVKQFSSEQQYNKLTQQINRQNTLTQTKILDFLKQQTFQAQEWKKCVQIYKNQIEIDLEQIDKENGKTIKLRDLIENFLNTNNQKKQMKQILTESRSVPINGKIQQICGRYLKKLQIFKDTDDLIKLKVDPQIAQITEKLDSQIIFYQTELKESMKTLNEGFVKSFEIFESNKQQIYRILFSLKENNILKYRFENKQQSLFKNIEGNLKFSIKNIWKSIEDLLFTAETPKYLQVKDSILEIIKFLKFIKKRKQSNKEKIVESQNGVSSFEDKCITQTLQNAENILEQIQNKLFQTSNRCKVSNYEVNSKLVVCYYVLKLFINYDHESNNEQKKQKRTEALKLIRTQLLKPFAEMKNNFYFFFKDYQKLYKVLKYLRDLDNVFLDVGINDQQFHTVLPISNNEEIKKNFATCSLRIQTTYKFFKPLLQLFEKKHFPQQYQNSNYEQDQIFKSMVRKSSTQKFRSKIKQPSIIEEQKPVIKKTFEKDLNTSSSTNQKNLYDYLDSKTINTAINYIHSFENLKRILKDFKNDIPNETTFTRDQHKLESQFDLKKQFVKIFQAIEAQVEEAKNPTIKRQLSRQNLYSYFKQLAFLGKILNEVKSSSDNFYVEKMQTEIKSLISQQHLSFDDMFKNAIETYKYLNTGVQFDQLRKLLQNSFSNDTANKARILQLLRNIENQYSQKIIRKYFPELGKNTDVLINMAEFKKIIEENPNFSIPITYYNEVFLKKCQEYFKQLYRKYIQYIKNLKLGVPINEKEEQQLVNEEDKIKYLLSAEYQIFKNKHKSRQLGEQALPNITDEIHEKSRQIEKQIAQKYVKDTKAAFKVDSLFKQVYFNTTKQNKDKIKANYTEKCKKIFKQMSRYLSEDHQKLSQEIESLDRQLEMVPKEIEVQIREEFQKIKKQFQNTSSLLNSKLQSLLSKKSLEGLLSQIDNAEKMKNTEMKRCTLQALQRYFADEKKQINLSQLQTLQKRLEILSKSMKSQQYIILCQKVVEIKQFYGRYLNQLKQIIYENNQQLFMKIQAHKQKLNELNKSQNFKIRGFITSNQNEIKPLIDVIKIMKKYQDLFSNELTLLITALHQQIQSEKTKLCDIIDKFKVDYLQPLSKGACTTISSALVDEIPARIKIFIFTKDHCSRLNQFTSLNFFPQIKINQLVQQSQKLLRQLQKALEEKYTLIEKWDLLSCLTNDTEDRIIENFKNIQKEVELLNKLHPIVNSRPNNQEINIEAEFHQANLNKLNGLEQLVLYDLNDCFTDPRKTDGGKIRKYYDLYNLLDRKKIKILAKNVVLSNTVRKELIKKFSENTSKIEQFANQTVLINQFRALSSQEQVVDQKEKNLLNTKRSERQNKQQQFKTINDSQLEVRKKGVVQSDPTLKNLQIQRIEKQYKAKFDNKKRDLQLQLQNQESKIKGDSKVKRSQIYSRIHTLINDSLVIYLIINKYATTYFYCEEKIKSTKLELNELLKKIQLNYTKKFTKHLYDCLSSNTSKYCEQVLNEPIFKPYLASVFAKDTEGQNFPSLIASVPFIQSDPKKKNVLLDLYNKFQRAYQGTIDYHRMSSNHQYAECYLIDEIIGRGKYLETRYKENRHNKDEVVQLLGNIFAVWSIVQSDVDEGKQIVYMYKPHPGQVLSIFLLLGLEKSAVSNQIQKRIVQIQTGQGKSIVLGGLSAFLALIGYKVYEACYSKYLSSRDFESFSKLFTKLRIQDRIQYNIFSDICKSLLDWDKTETFCQMVQRYIEDSKKNILSQGFKKFLNLFKRQAAYKVNNDQRKILLIDQADVFLKQDYLAQNYLPSIRYYTENVENLLLYLWNKRSIAENLDPEVVYQSKQFKNVVAEFNNKIFEKIMKNQVHGMIRDLINYKTDVYTLMNKRIYYKEGDGLSDKIKYGYRTIFSYFHEYEVKKQINFSDVSQHIGLSLSVASFSYSLLPSYFDSILGVTGTLESMSDGQKKILQQNFKVGFFVQPSIYPKSRRTISFKKCLNTELYPSIVKSIEQESSKRRPVLVFFKKKEQTYNFFDSRQFAQFRQQASIVTYEVEADSRDFRIKVATDECQITILTVDFARGTDFKVVAKDKDKHEGLHVISACLPQNYSDYIQLIGRTGRQGRRGTALIFMVSDKIDSGQKSQQITQGNGQSIIKDNERKFWSTKYLQIKQKMVELASEHENSLKIYKQRPSIDQILENIYQLNFQPSIQKFKSRTVLCLDGTVSMSSVFQKVKQVISGAMPDIYESIQKSKVKAEFEIKFVVYRNYNSSHKELLEYSNFESKSEPLMKWLRNVGVSGGWGNEAIEVCLQYINGLPDINQFVIIADARANEQSQTISKRLYNKQGQSYWNKNGFPITYYDNELNLIKAKRVKGHSYYIGSQLKSFFNSLSASTGGQSKQFFVDAQNATKDFADFVSERILTNLGQLVGGDAKARLLENYKNISSKKKYV